MMITLFISIQLSKYLNKIASWMRDKMTQVVIVVLNFGENTCVKEYTDACRSLVVWGAYQCQPVFPLILMQCKQGVWYLAEQQPAWTGAMDSGSFPFKAFLTSHLYHNFFKIYGV